MTSHHEQRGGSVWSGRTPEEEDEDEGPWDWARGAARHAFLLGKPGNLRLGEAREIVRLERRMGQAIAYAASGGGQ
jgi:hypothetical protein